MGGTFRFRVAFIVARLARWFGGRRVIWKGEHLIPSLNIFTAYRFSAIVESARSFVVRSRALGTFAVILEFSDISSNVRVVSSYR